MRAPIILYWIFVCLIFVQPETVHGSDPALADEVRTGCCRALGSDPNQLLKTADRLYAQFKPKEAAGELQKVLQSDPRNFEAMVKLCRAHIDIGDMIPESAPDWKERKLKEYTTAEDYAHKAVTINPNSTWGYFYIAASLGNIAVLSPVAKQIDLAAEIRSAVEKAIAHDPQNGFAYHVYGVWHRKMAEIGKSRRVFASLVYGRSVPMGSLDKSIEYLKKAVALNPTVIASRLELAKSYIAAENWVSARNSLTAIKELPIQFSDDAKHKRNAEELLEQIKER